LENDAPLNISRTSCRKAANYDCPAPQYDFCGQRGPCPLGHPLIKNPKVGE